MDMSIVRMGFVLLASAQLVAASPSVVKSSTLSKPDMGRKVDTRPLVSGISYRRPYIQIVARAPSVSDRLTALCMTKHSNSVEACHCLGDLAHNNLGHRAQEIVLARKEGRKDVAKALMKDLDLSGAIQLVKNLKNFSKTARKDCKIKFRMKAK